jgi:hypothetical protein
MVNWRYQGKSFIEDNPTAPCLRQVADKLASRTSGNKQSNQHGPRALAQHESEDVALLCAESDADADFARAEDDALTAVWSDPVPFGTGNY